MRPAPTGSAARLASTPPRPSIAPGRRVDVDVAGLSETGLVRTSNEDQFLIATLRKSVVVEQTSLESREHEPLAETPQGSLLIVADGIGGHGGGDVASRLAVDVLRQYALHFMPWLFRLDGDSESVLTDDLREAIERCQREVQSAAETRGFEFPMMGTTLTMAYVVWPRLFVVHVGDSRGYVYSGGRLRQITRDHTLAQQLKDQNAIDEGQVEHTRWSHVLWNTVGGGNEAVDPEIFEGRLEPGDVVMLCTDGLTKHVDDATLETILGGRSSSTSKDKTRALVDAALDDGGSDNVTAVVAQFGAPTASA